MECNFARTAIKELLQEHNTNGKKLDVHKINEEYNKLFKAYPGMQISAIAAFKTFLRVSKNFNKRWHPQTTVHTSILSGELAILIRRREGRTCVKKMQML